MTLCTSSNSTLRARSHISMQYDALTQRQRTCKICRIESEAHVADGVVRGVHHHHLVVLVRRVLVDPVRVEHAEAAARAADALLRERAQALGRLELRDALVYGLAVHDALRAQA